MNALDWLAPSMKKMRNMMLRLRTSQERKHRSIWLGFCSSRFVMSIETAFILDCKIVSVPECSLRSSLHWKSLLHYSSNLPLIVLSLTHGKIFRSSFRQLENKPSTVLVTIVLWCSCHHHWERHYLGFHFQRWKKGFTKKIMLVSINCYFNVSWICKLS